MLCRVLGGNAVNARQGIVMNVTHGTDREGPMIDASFLRTLEVFDPSLEVRWNWRIEAYILGRHVDGREGHPNRDKNALPAPFPAREYRTGDRWRPIVHICTERKEFMPLDFRVIRHLAMSDMWSSATIEKFHKRMETEEDHREAAAERDFEYEAQCVADDVTRYLYNLPEKKRFWN